jgi:hypothetical protein
MPLTHYSKFSMFTLRIWVFKSGVLKNIFILSKHGTKANIWSAKMANNRHAYNRDVLQSYWTSLADFRWFLTVLVDRRLLGSQCCLSMGLVANGIRLTKHCNALLSRSDVTRGRMVRRRISEEQRWQIIGMHTTGMPFKAIEHQMGYHYTVVNRNIVLAIININIRI